MPRRKWNEAERDEKFKQGFLWCSGCNKYHYHTHFSTPGGNYGYAWRCKKHKNQYQRESGITKKANEKRLKKYHQDKKDLIDLLGGKCQNCGYDIHWVLQFHHVLPSEKEMAISRALQLGDKNIVEVEADKCCILCANCHGTLGKTWEGRFEKLDYGWTMNEQTREVLDGG